MFKNFLCILFFIACPSLADDFIYPEGGLFGPKIFQSTKDCRTTKMATIDLLFVQESHLRGLSQETSKWVSAINRYFKDSRVYLHVRKAGLVDHDFKSTQMRDKLTELKDNQELRDLRDQYRADFVMGVVEDKDSVAIGMGYLSTSAEYAFSVVKPNGGTITAAHELGHNLGLGHSVLQGSRGNPYPWGRGHGVKNKFGTIMTYAFLYPAPRVHKFSNPQVRCAGLRCGVGGDHARSANSARAINCVRFHVSRHR